MTERANDGPSLQQYVETRFNLLDVSVTKLEHSLAERFAAIEQARALALRFVEERFRHHEQLSTQAQENAKRAVDKAEAAQSAHNTAANEWRGTLNDFKATLVSREEFQRLDRDFSAYRLEVSRLIASQTGASSAVRETKDDSSRWIGLVVGVGGVLIALATLLLHR